MTADQGVDGRVATPSRRAPFSDNPSVGVRGLQTQQRILDAGVQVFEAIGYDGTTLDRIAQIAGCSRVSIYQYFSGKEDIFRHLAAQVSRQLTASTEALETVTVDEDGLTALRRWVSRYADIYARYEPVFRAFTAVAEIDAELVGGASGATERNVASFLARTASTSLPPRQLEAVVRILLAGVNRSLDLASVLRSDAPDTYTAERVDQAIADVVHRVLFGYRAGVNARHRDVASAPLIRISPALREMFEQARGLELESTQPGRRALASMLAVGDDVVASSGYRGVRVSHVVAAAGVSHGTFYRYFDNIGEYVLLVATRALVSVSTAFRELPDIDDRNSVRRWLRHYTAVHAANVATMRVWAEAVESSLRSDRAAVFDWGRRRLVPLLAGREFGDLDVDALVLMAMIEASGSADRSALALDAGARILEQGFFSQELRG